MSEDKKEKKPEAAKPEVKKDDKAAGDAAGKHKKVTKLTLKEVDAALEGIQKTMGGYQSRYAETLLAQREVLKKYGD